MSETIRTLIQSIASRLRVRPTVASLVPFIYLWCCSAKGNAVHLTVRKLCTYVLNMCNCPSNSSNVKARLNFLLSALVLLAKRNNMEDAVNIIEANRLIYVWSVDKLKQLLEKEFPEISEIVSLMNVDKNLVLGVLCEEVCK